ncbi:MAG: hypothetical protein AAFV77_04275 [Planctomycetota bacterium]
MSDAAASARGSRTRAALVIGSMLLGVLAVSAIGVGGAWVATVFALASTWLAAGALAGAYMAGAWGLGAAALRWMEDRAAAAWLAPAVGLGLMLAVSHGMGVLGAFEWFGTGGRRVVAGLPVGAGLVLLAADLLKRRSGEGVSLSPMVLAFVPAVAVLVVASASPPGWLWASEGFGYDTRSYHMQLPAEWLAMGRLAPLEHNVYSFLPGYVEAAFYHLLSLVGEHPAAGAGLGVLAGQCLSVLMAVLSAVLIARVCWVVIPEEARNRLGGMFIALGALVLGTPWVIATGSLAYNEPAVLALGAGAMLVAMSQGGRVVPRWALAAFLVGSACGAKPTALFMLGPVVGALLLVGTPARELWKGLLVGVLVGTTTLLPWLVRNEIATGNPVFPQLAGVFGLGHWTPEQHARWASGHTFDGSALDRIRLLVLPDPGGPFLGGTSMRGLLHPQWGLLGVLCLLAAVAGPVLRRNVVVAALSIGFAAQLVAWLVLTHLQSRFLMPVVLTGVPLVAVSLVRLGSRGAWVAIAIAVAQCAWGVWTYASERDGRPGLAIAPGVGLFTGVLDPQASPQGVANSDPVRGNGDLLLIGDGAPLYFLSNPRYATTWDSGLLIDVVAAHPDQPAEQAAALRAEGVRWLVVDEMELSRLRASGWLDPALTPRAVGELAGQGTPAGYWGGPGALGRILIDLGPR